MECGHGHIQEGTVEAQESSSQQQGHGRKGQQTPPGSSFLLASSLSSSHRTPHTRGWPCDRWGPGGQSARSPLHGSVASALLRSAPTRLVLLRLMRPRLRPCAGGLALFLGDQVLEPKLTVTTLCALPLGQGRRRGKGGGPEGRKRRMGGGRRGQEEGHGDEGEGVGTGTQEGGWSGQWGAGRQGAEGGK